MSKITIVKKQQVSNDTMYLVLILLPLALLLWALCTTPFESLMQGIITICKSDDILLTDYLLIAGTGATFVNVALVMLCNIYLLRKLELRPNGIIIATLFLLAGFSFMGKNLFNIWPFYLGGYLYSRYHGISYKNVIVISMLATALSPISSFVMELVPNHPFLGVFLMWIVGAFIGFVMPTISAHMVTFHGGYSLYNMGTAAGFFGMLVYALVGAMGLTTQRNTDLLEVNTGRIILFFILYAFILIGLGFKLNGKTFKGYRHIFKYSGRLVTDFIKLESFGIALINMGVLALMGIVYILLVGGTFNGPTIAALLTFMGFGGFGKHPKNSLPILLGVTLSFFLFRLQLPISTLVISALFGTTLAPIAGEYGFILGTIAGMLHMVLVLTVGDAHGGLVLYNNGLSGGILAALYIPMIDAFRKDRIK